MKKTILLSTITALSLFCACNKKTTQTQGNELETSILYNTAHEVCKASYVTLNQESVNLENAIVLLQTTPSQQNLQTCRDKWKALRMTWEQTESWLFGPISADNIDPRIDTWPVDFNAIDSVLNTSNVLNETYINQLDDALKGFHPIEYFLWGSNGNKTYSDFTPRQLEFLVALAHNVTKLTGEVKSTWENGFAAELSNAGKGSASYTTQQVALVEIVDAMAGICDEVANGKISDPFIAQNPTLEESPFSSNSLVDFTNNIQGVMKIYQANLYADQTGLEDLVRKYNLSLDQEIKAAHANAIASLQSISVPFGTAIISQPILVQQAIDQINTLEQVLSTKLKPFVIQYVK